METNQPIAGEVLSLSTSSATLAERRTTTILKAPSIRVMSIELPAGEELKEHKAPGAITVHCTVGKVLFTAMGHAKEMHAGQLLYLDANEQHAVKAIENSMIVVTIAMPKKV